MEMNFAPVTRDEVAALTNDTRSMFSPGQRLAAHDLAEREHEEARQKLSKEDEHVKGMGGVIWVNGRFGNGIGVVAHLEALRYYRHGNHVLHNGGVCFGRKADLATMVHEFNDGLPLSSLLLYDAALGAYQAEPGGLNGLAIPRGFLPFVTGLRKRNIRLVIYHTGAGSLAKLVKQCAKETWLCRRYEREKQLWSVYQYKHFINADEQAVWRGLPYAKVDGVDIYQTLNPMKEEYIPFEHAEGVDDPDDDLGYTVLTQMEPDFQCYTSWDSPLMTLAAALTMTTPELMPVSG